MNCLLRQCETKNRKALANKMESYKRALLVPADFAKVTAGEDRQQTSWYQCLSVDNKCSKYKMKNWVATVKYHMRTLRKQILKGNYFWGSYKCNVEILKSYEAEMGCTESRPPKQ